MATLLQLCKDVRREVGASGDDNTVVGATGEWGRIVEHVRTAWEEIQGEAEEPGWEFMRKAFSFVTIPEQAEYEFDLAPLSLTDFSAWKPWSFRLFQDTFRDEIYLQYLPYAIFRDTYLLGSFRESYSVPTVITISPAKSLVLALPPLGAYTVSGEYYTTATKLVNDADVPELPERYHRAIMYRAMMHYGMYEVAEEVVKRGATEYARMLERIQISELPDTLTARSFI